MKIELPALNVQITGGVTKSNLEAYKSTAMRFIDNINTDLKTDEDFADADALVKFCNKTEKELDGVKEAALTQTKDIADLFKAIDDLKSHMRSKRLELNKLVTARKQAIRDEIAASAKKEWMDFIAEKNMPEVNIASIVSAPDFAAAMKNKRTIKSLQQSVNDELSRAKTEAMDVIDNIQSNIELVDQIAGELKNVLCHDLAQLVTKDDYAIRAIVTARKAEYEERERQRIEAERKRIEEQERKKIEAERKRIEEQERRKAEAELKAKAEQEAKRDTAVDIPAKQESVQHKPEQTADKKNMTPFERWWHQEGSGMRPNPSEDVYEFTKRVAMIAWQNGEFHGQFPFDEAPF